MLQPVVFHAWLAAYMGFEAQSNEMNKQNTNEQVHVYKVGPSPKTGPLKAP